MFQKYGHIFACCIAGCLLLFSCTVKKQQTDLTLMNLDGKVRSVTDKDYFLDTVGKQTGKTLRWINYYAFNEKGMLTKKLFCNDRNDTISRRDYFYDTLGRLQKEMVYADGILMYRIKYVYDSQGNKTAMLKYKYNDTLDCADRYFYNKQQLCIARIQTCDMPFIVAEDYSYFTDHQTDSFFYNDKKQKIRLKHIAKDTFAQVTSYTYNEQGNCIAELVDTTRMYEPKRTTRKFDEKGRITEEISLDAKGNLYTKKSIQYLQPDKQGNATIINIHWHDLGPSITERTLSYY